jgi:ribosome maturation factor RimP
VVIRSAGNPRFSVVGAETITTSLVEAFERTATALPHERGFTGLEIVSSRAQRARGVTALELVIDTPSGVDLAMCERVAARINAALDECTEPYTLAVESPGLDRPLLRPSDYERFRGRAVRVLTTIPVEGAKTHRGTLTGIRGNAVIVQTQRGELPLPLEMVKSAHLDVDVRADLAREKRERRQS